MTSAALGSSTPRTQAVFTTSMRKVIQAGLKEVSGEQVRPAHPRRPKSARKRERLQGNCKVPTWYNKLDVCW
jgi:hypothetical protein